MRLLHLSLIAIFVVSINASWWDDFTGKINAGVDYVKETAVPAVGDAANAVGNKFQEAKQTYHESEAPQKVENLAKESWSSVNNFFNEKVAPKVNNLFNGDGNGNGEENQD